MTYGGVNFLAVLVATIAAMAAGAVWYSVLAKPWMAAAGVRPDDPAAQGGGARYLVAFISKFVMAYCLAKLLGVLDAVSAGNAVAAALFLWLGFVATTLSVNHRFQLRPWSLTLIDGGYWLLVLTMQGIVIGFFA